MDDPDLDRIEENALTAGLAERDVERVFGLARRGLRAERETCRTCKHGEEYRPDRVDCLYHSAIYHAAHYCSRWEAK